jgi:CDP-paratose 2-epimerase
MKILITGICGFVGSSLAREFQDRLDNLQIFGLDNLSRPGSEMNRQTFRDRGIRLLHGDIRNPSDLESLPKVDWVVDAAANPSVLAGISGTASSRQLMEHNLVGTLHLLEYCKQHSAGFLMLSTSRVYSLSALCALPMEPRAGAFVPLPPAQPLPGFSARGISESFSSRPPLSLYGSAKLSSELLALEYGAAFGFPVHVNRCGVMAGAGQLGKADQGIFAFWIHSYCRRRPLRYIGFGGTGHQVRDCLHPRDLAELAALQLSHPEKAGQVLNVSGGLASSRSLAQLSAWCAHRFGPHDVSADTTPRPFDVPWLILDAARAESEWGWKPSISVDSVCEEIARHAEAHPDWLDRSRDP